MYPDGLRYTPEHEWIRRDGSARTVGITAYAAEQLGDVTYVELPELDTEVKQGDEIAVVESVKAANDLYSPVGGRVTEVNQQLDDSPELVNESPYEDGWFYKLADVAEAELDALMDAAAYKQYVEELDP